MWFKSIPFFFSTWYIHDYVSYWWPDFVTFDSTFQNYTCWYHI